MTSFNQKLNALALQIKALLVKNGENIEIVNNLTTSDATKALSAEMGVFIAQSFGQSLNDLTAVVDLKAPLDSPNFTGDPAAPTQVQGTNDSKLATTQFVNDAVYNAINALISSAPENLNQLNELAAALNNDPNFATTILNAVANKLAIDVVMTLTTLQKNNVFASLGLQAGATASNTDGLDEGATRKYFTEARVLASVLAGLVTTNSSAVVATDTVLVALGKLQKQIADNDTKYIISTDASGSKNISAADCSATGNKIIKFTNAANITFPQPQAISVPVGHSVNLRQGGTGILTLVGSGATLEGVLTTSSQHETKTVIAQSATSWLVIGG